jgi:hypothetical protein
MIESQVTTEDVQECASSIPEIETWRLSPEFETGEAQQIPVTQITRKKPRRPTITAAFQPEPIYAYAQAALAKTRQADQRIWLAVWICGAAVLLLSFLKALAP